MQTSPSTDKAWKAEELEANIVAHVRCCHFSTGDIVEAHDPSTTRTQGLFEKLTLADGEGLSNMNEAACLARIAAIRDQNLTALGMTFDGLHHRHEHHQKASGYNREAAPPQYQDIFVPENSPFRADETADSFLLQTVERLRAFLRFSLAIEYGLLDECKDKPTPYEQTLWIALAVECFISPDVTPPPLVPWDKVSYTQHFSVSNEYVERSILRPARYLGLPEHIAIASLRVFLNSLRLFGKPTYTSVLDTMNAEFGTEMLAGKLYTDRPSLIDLVCPPDQHEFSQLLHDRQQQIGKQYFLRLNAPTCYILQDPQTFVASATARGLDGEYRQRQIERCWSAATLLRTPIAYPSTPHEFVPKEPRTDSSRSSRVPKNSKSRNGGLWPGYLSSLMETNNGDEGRVGSRGSGQNVMTPFGNCPVQ